MWKCNGAESVQQVHSRFTRQREDWRKKKGRTAGLQAAEQESGLGGKQQGSMPGGNVCSLLFPVPFSGEEVYEEVADANRFTSACLKLEPRLNPFAVYKQTFQILTGSRCRLRRGLDASLRDPGCRTASPSFSPPQPGLIQLDQDDTNNWPKLETVCRPNDPYLTLLFCLRRRSSLFQRRAPFGVVYLGSVASASARIPPLDAASALTS